MNKQLQRAPKFVYPPVNHCIYCGNAEDNLTDEHIVPFGLNGNLVQPNSSCTKCAKTTSTVELHVLKGFLENGRRAMGVTSRHKKHEKPSSVPVKFITGEMRLDGKMPIEGCFHTIHLPVFATPLALGVVLPRTSRFYTYRISCFINHVQTTDSNETILATIDDGDIVITMAFLT